MRLTKKQLESLIKTVSLTKSDELGCDDCLKQLAEFAETMLAGKSVPQGMQAIQHHLSMCGECQEEYQALLAALKEEDSGRQA